MRADQAFSTLFIYPLASDSAVTYIDVMYMDPRPLYLVAGFGTDLARYGSCSPVYEVTSKRSLRVAVLSRASLLAREARSKDPTYPRP